MTSFINRAALSIEPLRVQASNEDDLEYVFAVTVEAIKKALSGSKSTLLPTSARSTGSRPVLITSNSFILDMSHISKIKKAIDAESLDTKWDLKGQAVEGGYPTAVHDFAALIYVGEDGDEYVEVMTVSAIGAVYVTKSAG